MRSLFEEYGLAIFIIFVCLITIVIASPLGDKITLATNNTVSESITKNNVQATNTEIPKTDDLVNVSIENISYEIYVNGNMLKKSNNIKTGITGKEALAEAIRINATVSGTGDVSSNAIKYQCYINGEGWTDTASLGEICGEPDSGKKITALKIWSDSTIFLSRYSIQYKTFTYTGGWSSWSSNNEISGLTSSDAAGIQAIQIYIQEK